MKKELRKIIINFSDINKRCDSEYKKLYDKMHDLELSHNRKLKLLEKIKNQLIEIIEGKSYKTKYNPFITTETRLKFTEHLQKTIDEIELEINAMLRVKSKPIKIKSEPLNPKDILYLY